MHASTAAFNPAVSTGLNGGVQVEGVNTPPAEHEWTPVERNPLSQTGWQVLPGANEAVQSPTPPLVGAMEASLHLVQVEGVNTAPNAAHEDTPEEVNPSAQRGWQLLPGANEAVQVPTPPLVGGVEASHGQFLFAVLLPKSVNALAVPVKDSQAPPQSVPEYGLPVNICAILVTAPVSQPLMSWLNFLDDWNSEDISVTAPVSQPLMSWLNTHEFANILCIVVTLLMSQLEMS